MSSAQKGPGEGTSEEASGEGHGAPRDAAVPMVAGRYRLGRGAWVPTAGVLHRHVKPHNIMIGVDGRVVLTDFGLAQIHGEQALTRTGMLMGSAEFIPPERVLGRIAVPASDFFSLGVVLYTAVEGYSPFLRKVPEATFQAIMNARPADPIHAGPLTPLIMAMLEKDPEQRPSGVVLAARCGRGEEALPVQPENARHQGRHKAVEDRGRLPAEELQRPRRRIGLPDGHQDVPDMKPGPMPPGPVEGSPDGPGAGSQEEISRPGARTSSGGAWHRSARSASSAPPRDA